MAKVSNGTRLQEQHAHFRLYVAMNGGAIRSQGRRNAVEYHVAMNRSQLISVLASPLVAGTAAHRAMAATEQRFPDVLAVTARAAQAGAFDFDVTVSSPYDTPARYADGIRARSNDGLVYGELKLFHDHAAEQPFTRDIYGFRVPSGIHSVVIEARDQRNGYGGKTQLVQLPGR